MDLQQLIEHLSRPEAYPDRAGPVRRLETHTSALFFAGGFVYKVKKPVQFDFLDFRSLEARLHYCKEEVRLNKALAGSIYLGVVPICKAPDGGLEIDIEIEGDAEIVEYAVKMRELPGERMLDRLLESGDIDNQKLRDIAAILARFHSEAATGPGVDEHGAPDAVARNALDNFQETRNAPTISKTLHGFLERSTVEFLDDHKDLFQRRVQDGRIREGHGDLHAGNICILKSKGEATQQIVIYDRIEFSAAFRCGDVASDLAFLLMDLDRMGYAAFGGFLLQVYMHLAEDPEASKVVGFYKTYRAMVRGKVASLRLAQLDDPDSEEAQAARAEAADYFYLAASYSLPPALILTCGLPGSGKSWLAGHVAQPLRARVLNSDAVRKRLAGLAPTQSAKAPFGEGIYDAESTRRTYAALLATAEETVRNGRAVIVDAGFRTAAQRRPFLKLARRISVPLVVLGVEVTEDVLRQRLGRRDRDRDQHQVSDADLSILDQVRAGFEPPDEVPEHQRLSWTGQGDIHEAVADVLDMLVRSVDT